MTCEASQNKRLAQRVYATGRDRSRVNPTIPGYLNDLVTLQQKQPKFYQYLQDSGFFVYGFLPGDSLPLLLTRRLKRQYAYTARGSQGGVTGFTFLKVALTRRMATRHTTAQYAEALKNSQQTTAKKTAEHGKTRMSKDEQASSR